MADAAIMELKSTTEDTKRNPGGDQLFWRPTDPVSNGLIPTKIASRADLNVLEITCRLVASRSSESTRSTALPIAVDSGLILETPAATRGRARKLIECFISSYPLHFSSSPAPVDKPVYNLRSVIQTTSKIRCLCLPSEKLTTRRRDVQMHHKDQTSLIKDGRFTAQCRASCLQDSPNLGRPSHATSLEKLRAYETRVGELERRVGQLAMAPWQAGAYKLMIRGTLEDPAGNRLGSRFETSIDAQPAL
jgi:hypothetical protein